MNTVKSAVLILCFFLFQYQGTAQIPASIAKANKTLSERGEVYLKFQKSDLASVMKLNTTVSIDRSFDEGWVYAYANKKQFEEFTKLNIDFDVLTAPGLLYEPVMKGNVNVKSVDVWDFYPTYDAYVDIMYQFETDYPELCRVVDIGTTVEGRKLLFAKISGNVNTNEAEPRFMYTSTMHGDETGGYITMLHLIDYLLSNYGSNSELTNLVDNTEIWINPLANPDGTYALGNSSVWGAKRYNGNNIDLNRNYPDPEDGPHPDGNEWQPETEAFMSLADSLHFTMSANLHAGSEVCNYPWDTWSKLSADDNWWQFVCHEYADTAQFYSPSGYMNQFDNGITNGYAWYSINGGRQDYMNYFAGCREFTLEISNTKLLMENKLLLYWEYNYRSLLNYMKQVSYGFRGIITDAETGDPVTAKVEILNHDIDNSFVYSGNEFGDFYRPVFEGNYDLKFSADGYKDKILEGESVGKYETVVLNVSMEKSTGISENEINQWFVLSPNPVSGFLTVNYSGNEKLDFQISVYTVKGEKLFSGKFEFQKNNRKQLIDMREKPAGVYFVTISSNGSSLTKKVIKK